MVIEVYCNKIKTVKNGDRRVGKILKLMFSMYLKPKPPWVQTKAKCFPFGGTPQGDDEFSQMQKKIDSYSII